MCSSLKLEKRSKVTPMGGIISSSYLEGCPPNIGAFTWNGFARTDGSVNKRKSMGQQWDPKKWIPVIIKVSSFTEKDKNGFHRHFPAHRLGAIISVETRTLKLLTRPSRTEDEKAVHPRMPSRVPKKMSLKEYVAALNKVTGGRYVANAA